MNLLKGHFVFLYGIGEIMSTEFSKEMCKQYEIMPSLCSNTLVYQALVHLQHG